jgi:general secretion pathway protein C
LPPVQPSARTTASAGGSSVSVERIVDARLFGQPSAEAPAPVVLQEDAPDTQLSLELRGTITASEESRGMAIIAERGGAERVYFVGDAVPGGAPARRAPRPGAAARGGRLEALRLPRSEDPQAGSAPRRHAALRRRRSARPPCRRSSSRAPPPSPRSSGRSPCSRTAPAGLPRLSRPAAPAVRPARPAPGDLITQINGMALDDPARGMEIFRSLADATRSP